MKFGKDDDGEDLDIGRVPLIFVAHSMGGLVAKKAYLLGQNDETYKDIVSSISAMVFLATPHRGTHLAEVLKRLLSISFQPSRKFIADLNKNSLALEDINEQFRHVVPKLSVWSFYETKPTPIVPVGLIKLMVLDKDSSILGYPKEISRPLDADHHGMCKYSSPNDSNYISVRNALISLVKRFRSPGLAAVSTRVSEEIKYLREYLVVSSSPEEELSSVRRRWIPGTCDWLLNDPDIQTWLETDHEPCITWYCAPPATGKSTLSAHVISHLCDSGVMCHHFFFRFDDPNKRSLSVFLRSMAYQIARDIPAFKHSLTELASEKLNFEKANSMLIWKKLFESILFAMDLPNPIYWVIDALDESDSPQLLLELLRSLTSSKTSLRVLVVSRKTEPLSVEFGRLANVLPCRLIERDDPDFNLVDIRLLVKTEIKHMRGSDELRRKVAQDVASRARGNFLWARLVLEDIINCHSKDEIQEALNDIPDGMNNLYRRMELSILNCPRKANTVLAKAILQWLTCASRLLTLEELSQALRPELPEMLDLKRTIQDVCGQFIMMNSAGQVTIVHQTARDFLIRGADSESFIDLQKGHGELFMKSVSVLCDPSLRSKLTHSQHALRNTEPFLFYAATSWTYHLRNMGEAADGPLDMLVGLFKHLSVLTWIHALALLGELVILDQAAEVLTTFVGKRHKMISDKHLPLNRLSDIDLLERWTIDLVKVTAKFSRHLYSDPSAIYKLIPPLCPESSILHQQFYQPGSDKFAIRGISNTSWNANLARIDLPHGDRARKITCAGQKLAILGWTGNVYLWSSLNFTEVFTIRHQEESVTAFCLDSEANRLVTYGPRSTKFWSVPSSQLLSSVPNPTDSEAKSMTFVDNDAKVLIGSDDGLIRYLNTKNLEAGWQIVNSNLLKEHSRVGGPIISSPVCMAFNGDGTQVGVSYRGFPLSVWALNEGYCVGRCKRVKASRNDHAFPSNNWFPVDQFTWNPISGHTIGVYKGGWIFKWHPVTDAYKEADCFANGIAASSDGKLFVTSSSDGTVRVWDFVDFIVVHQIFSEDLVRDLVFSPDCRRFYDLRGSSVSAWGPYCHPFAKTEGCLSGAASECQPSTSISPVSKAGLVHHEAVIVVAVAPSSTWYCVGNEEGQVDLFDTRTGDTTELFSVPKFLSVHEMVWSQDATRIAAADLAGRVFIKILLAPPPDGDDKLELKSLAALKVDLDQHGIHHLLFNDDSTLLLIMSDDRGQIWSVNDEAVVATAVFDQVMDRKWLQHPTQKSSFLGFGATDIRVFRWKDFSELPRLHFHQDRPRLDTHTVLNPAEDLALDSAQLPFGADSNPSASSTVNRAMLTQDTMHILVQAKGAPFQGQKFNQVFIFDISSFDPEGEENATPTSLPYAYIPPDISSNIEIPLGILSGSRLAFLDQDLWFCTFRLKTAHNYYDDDDEDAGALRRHYFVPRDWTSTESVEQCCMMADGSLLCPKEDRVAVISSDLEGSGF